MGERLIWGTVSLLASTVAAAFSTGMLTWFFVSLMALSCYLLLSNNVIRTLRSVSMIAIFGLIIAVSKTLESVGIPPLSRVLS
tara:strand:- start:202 stop:450 length:249 start_codon:yes stop_codon:yes gene_type:complete